MIGPCAEIGTMTGDESGIRIWMRACGGFLEKRTSVVLD